jgi:hypothetical protein
MLRMRRGRQPHHDRALKLQRQAPAAAQANASGPTSQGADPFCIAKFQPAARDAFLSLSLRKFEQFSISDVDAASALT